MAKRQRKSAKSKARTSTKRRAGKKNQKKTKARSRAGRPAPDTALIAAATTTAPCLPIRQAAALVARCAGRQFSADTKLEVLTDAKREQFCQCVARGSGVPRPRVPCSASSTFGDVINSISC